MSFISTLVLAVCLAGFSGASAASSTLRVSSSSSEVDKKKVATAFANSFVPSFQSVGSLSSSVDKKSTQVSAAASVKELSRGVADLDMSCRRNLKKEKRARNEAMARQFRKAPERGFRGGFRGGRGGRGASEAADQADSEWLAQIYGQHTMYRRDNEGPTNATPAEAKDKNTEAKKESEVTA